MLKLLSNYVTCKYLHLHKCSSRAQNLVFLNHLLALSKCNLYVSFSLQQILSPTKQFTESDDRKPPAESTARCRAGCGTAHILGTMHRLCSVNVADKGPCGLIDA